MIKPAPHLRLLELKHRGHLRQSGSDLIRRRVYLGVRVTRLEEGHHSYRFQYTFRLRKLSALSLHYSYIEIIFIHSSGYIYLGAIAIANPTSDHRSLKVT